MNYLSNFCITAGGVLHVSCCVTSSSFSAYKLQVSYPERWNIADFHCASGPNTHHNTTWAYWHLPGVCMKQEAAPVIRGEEQNRLRVTSKWSLWHHLKRFFSGGTLPSSSNTLQSSTQASHTALSLRAEYMRSYGYVPLAATCWKRTGKWVTSSSQCEHIL